MSKQNEVSDIKKSINYLKYLRCCLKNAVYKLPHSVIKQYLIFEIKKPVKNIFECCRLENKISNLLEVVMQENFCGYKEGLNVVKLLKETSEVLKKVNGYIRK